MVKGQCYWSDGVILSGFFLLLGWHPKCPGPCRPPWPHLTNTPPPGQPSVPGPARLPIMEPLKNAVCLAGCAFFPSFPTYLSGKSFLTLSSPSLYALLSLSSSIYRVYGYNVIFIGVFIGWMPVYTPMGVRGNIFPALRCKKEEEGTFPASFYHLLSLLT